MDIYERAMSVAIDGCSLSDRLTILLADSMYCILVFNIQLEVGITQKIIIELSLHQWTSRFLSHTACNYIFCPFSTFLDFSTCIQLINSCLNSFCI